MQPIECVLLAKVVMPGLVPGIHVLEQAARETWMAGTSPAMTEKQIVFKLQERNRIMDIKVRDSNGALLAEGDSVTLVKDLKLKGSSTVLKRGTVIRGIHLTDSADEIEGRTDKVKGLVLRTEFLKKA
jgi:protein PhnA